MKNRKQGTSDFVLLHGDCLQVLEDIEPGSVDMVLADIPYGSTRCPWDEVIPLEGMWSLLHRLIRDDGAIVLHASQPFASVLVFSNLSNFCYDWHWDKCFAGNFVQAKRQPLRTMESVWVFSKTGKMPRYFPQMKKRDKPIYKGGNKQSEAIPIAQTDKAKAFGQAKKRYDEKYPINYLRFNVRQDRGKHPTQKPVDLCEYLISTFSLEGDTILDIAMGSGSAGVAAINTRRHFIGVDIEQKYVKIAENRINEAFLQGKVVSDDVKE